MTERMEDRALRLKTLGNAVCPPQAYPIFRYIAMIENGTCGDFCPYGKEGDCPSLRAFLFLQRICLMSYRIEVAPEFARRLKNLSKRSLH